MNSYLLLSRLKLIFIHKLMLISKIFKSNERDTSKLYLLLQLFFLLRLDLTKNLFLGIKVTYCHYFFTQY